MNILLVLGHPALDSFNHAIADECYEALVSAGHIVWYHDLYAEGFDPTLQSAEVPRDVSLDEVVQRHCAQLEAADGIVIVHPNWWGQPPAILKGWVDRVFRPGVAYRFDEGDSGEGIPVGLLRAKVAVVFNTGNTSLARERDIFGDPLDGLWRDCIFGLCGVPDVKRLLFTVVVTSTLEERKDWLRRTRELVVDAFPPGA